MAKACAAAWTLALLLCACTDDDITLGSQCPSPASGRATLAPDAGPAIVYGTSCAPCDGVEPELDARGCPILVTWASCGGDICINDRLVPQPVTDAGRDGGSELDAGEEDGGDADGGGP